VPRWAGRTTRIDEFERFSAFPIALGSLATESGVQFDSCNRCQAQLVVRREASVTFTSVIADGVPVPNVADDLQRLKIEQELARIDRE
jgi:hypothetical protein